MFQLNPALSTISRVLLTLAMVIPVVPISANDKESDCSPAASFAPYEFRIAFSAPLPRGASQECGVDSACPNGRFKFGLQLVGYPAPIGYPLNPCDVVDWSFGDGTTKTFVGPGTLLDPAASIDHDFPTPGNYVIQAKVTNARGSRSAARTLVIADSASRLAFRDEEIRLSWPEGVEKICSNCIKAVEGSGVATITVLRDLDLSRTISANAKLWLDGRWWGSPSFTAALTFAPGVTEQSFAVPVPNDDVYSGSRFHPLALEDASGGTLIPPLVNRLLVIDDDPVPTMILDSAIALREGDGELTPLSMPVWLTSPMGVDVTSRIDYTEGSATFEDLYGAGPRLFVKAGETSGLFTTTIRGDSVPEPDETFQIELLPYVTDANPVFATTSITVTILNDDAALDPPNTKLAAATDVELTLDIGSPYARPETAILWTSDERVARAPQSVVIPAGATKVSFVVTARGRGTAEIGASVPGRTTRPATVTVTSSPRRRAARR